MILEVYSSGNKAMIAHRNSPNDSVIRIGVGETLAGSGYDEIRLYNPFLGCESLEHSIRIWGWLLSTVFIRLRKGGKIEWF